MTIEEKRDLLDFLVYETDRLDSVLKSRIALYERTLLQRGSEDRWALREPDELAKISDRVLKFKHFVNLLKEEIEAQ